MKRTLLLLALFGFATAGAARAQTFARVSVGFGSPGFGAFVTVGPRWWWHPYRPARVYVVPRPYVPPAVIVVPPPRRVFVYDRDDFRFRGRDRDFHGRGRGRGGWRRDR